MAIIQLCSKPLSCMFPPAGRRKSVSSAFVLPRQAAAAAAAGASQGLVSLPSCTCTPPAIVTVLPFHHPIRGFQMAPPGKRYELFYGLVHACDFKKNWVRKWHKLWLYPSQIWNDRRCKIWTESKEHGLDKFSRGRSYKSKRQGSVSIFHHPVGTCCQWPCTALTCEPGGTEPYPAVPLNLFWGPHIFLASWFLDKTSYWSLFSSYLHQTD